MINHDILIAGSSGFIGTQVTDYLQHQNADFLGLGLESSEKKNYKCIDLSDEFDVNSFVKNVQIFSVLIYLTGLAHSKGKGKDYEVFYKTNVILRKSLTDFLC